MYIIKKNIIIVVIIIVMVNILYAQQRDGENRLGYSAVREEGDSSIYSPRLPIGEIVIGLNFSSNSNYFYKFVNRYSEFDLKPIRYLTKNQWLFSFNHNKKKIFDLIKLLNNDDDVKLLSNSRFTIDNLLLINFNEFMEDDDIDNFIARYSDYEFRLSNIYLRESNINNHDKTIATFSFNNQLIEKQALIEKIKIDLRVLNVGFYWTNSILWVPKEGFKSIDHDCFLQQIYEKNKLNDTYDY